MMINTMLNWAKNTEVLLGQEEGQDLVEYALVLVFISLAAVAGLTAMGTSISDVIGQITTSLSG